jgi:hypothetical protein
MKFLIKLMRNGGILTGLLFISLWISQEICWSMTKSLIIFFIGYVLTELAVKYKLKIPETKSNKTLFL